MDPMTGALFVAASLGASILSSKAQAKSEAANTKLQVEQARLQASEATYERTKQFRQNIATNLALSGLGVGGVSGLRGVTSQNISDYFADTAALGRQDLFATASGQSNRALSRSRALVREVGAVTDAAQMAAQLGLFAKKGK